MNAAIELLPKQTDFVNATEREVLYSGAFGAGKSRAVCVKTVSRVAGRPGAREVLARKTLSGLKQTTLRSLLERDGDVPPVLPPGSYVYNQAAREVRVHGGGVILLLGIDDAKASARGGIGSFNLTGAGVDQCEELTEADWTALRGRIRVPVEGLPNQLYGACNPASPSHWLAVRFGLDGIHQPAKNCRAITTCSSDNWFLPPSYLEDLDTFQGVAHRRYVLGEWCGAEGLVYENWDRTAMIRTRSGPWRRTVATCDIGFTNPTAFLLIRQCETDAEGVHVEDEFYRRKMTPDEIIEQAKRWQTDYAPEVFIVDPSAAMLIETMKRAGINAIAGKNDVFGGIQTVSRYITTEAGQPRFTVAPHVEHLVREIESYEWMAGGKDAPVKANDHAVDALRYGLVHLSNGGACELDARWIGDRTTNLNKVGDYRSGVFGDWYRLGHGISDDGWTDIYRT